LESIKIKLYEYVWIYCLDFDLYLLIHFCLIPNPYLSGICCVASVYLLCSSIQKIHGINLEDSNKAGCRYGFGGMGVVADYGSA